MYRSVSLNGMRIGRGVFWCGAVVLVACVLSACRNAPLADMTRLTDARQRAADAFVQFVKTADAGNRAVMADTDETSETFAQEAEVAADAVSHDAESLTELLRSLGYSDESRVLQEFTGRFADYRALDRTILQLAVENTNLKAQKLSFGPAQVEADSFRDALGKIAMPSGASTDCGVQANIATAVAAVREVQALQAPHIAESDEAAMTRLEARTARAEAEARRPMALLAGIVPPESRSKLAEATAALDRFMALNGQIVTLSRRNSNVRSLALSLGQKRTLTAACEERLIALQDALARRGFTGTR